MCYPVLLFSQLRSVEIHPMTPSGCSQAEEEAGLVTARSPRRAGARRAVWFIEEVANGWLLFKQTASRLKNAEGFGKDLKISVTA